MKRVEFADSQHNRHCLDIKDIKLLLAGRLINAKTITKMKIDLISNNWKRELSELFPQDTVLFRKNNRIDERKH